MINSSQNARFVCFFFDDADLGNELRLANALGRLRDN